MKRAAWLTLLTIATVLGLGYTAGFFGPDVGLLAAPPLSLEGMMDEKLPEASKDAVKVKADNFACFVCHGNYKVESLALTHGKADVACAKCHGQSLDHRNDEDNITPPDTMYPAEKINKCCQECHKEHDAPAHEVIARWQKRCPDKADPAKLVCTDCHFQHRLDKRVVVWDKRTRKVLKQVEKK